jgi:TRAP-type transport system periplasmic protein
VLPSKVQERTFALLGADARQMDLTEAISSVVAGRIDAQENPLANTVTYGVHNFHRFHTLTGHFYLSRPIFLHRPTVAAWPADLQAAMADAVRDAVAYQRGLAVEEEHEAERTIRTAGCEIVKLSDAERAAFIDALSPLLAEAQATYGSDLLALLPG